MASLVWYGPQAPLEVLGFTLPVPLVYLKTRQTGIEPSAINPKSEVVEPEGFQPERPFRPAQFHPSYYPHWENMRPQGRWTYLWWLSQGRKPFPEAIAYAFLFLYGMERRVLQDQQDLEAVWSEVSRLHAESGSVSTSFHHYSEQLLWHMVAKHPEHASEAEIRALLSHMGIHRGYIPLELAVALWWFGSREIPVPPEAAYHLAVSYQTSGGVVMDRAEPELRRLFQKRFEERYGSGLMVEFMPRRSRTFLYHCANAYLPARGSAFSFADPFGKAKRFEKLAWLLGTCIEDLRRYAVVLGKNDFNYSDPAAWEVLPEELRTGAHPATEALVTLGGTELETSGLFTTQVSALAPLLGIPLRETMPVEPAKRLATSIDQCGFRVEPDPRLTGKGYGRDETVALFRSEADAPQDFDEDGRTRYQTCAFLLKAAFHVADAGGRVSQDNLGMVISHLLDTFAWGEDERRRFGALAALLVEQGIDVSSLRVPPGWSGETREGAGRLLLQLVERDGRINGAEEKALRALWKKLGLTPGVLNKELDAMSGRGVVFVGDYVAGSAGERLPAPPPGWNGAETKAPLTLDRSAIAALLQDTHHVQQALAEAMQIEEPQPEEPALNGTPVPEPAAPLTLPLEAAPSGLPLEQLPPRFHPLLTALLERDEWGEDEARDLAREQGVMLAGAVEAINDWAVENFGETLIWDEGDRLVVERQALPH